MNLQDKKNKKLYIGLRIIAFLALVILLDFSIGFLLRKFYFGQKYGTQARTTYAIESTTADVVIFGSSRANHHYVPQIFEDSLGLSFYNAGRDGNSIMYHYAVLSSIVERYTPKIVILDLMAAEFEKKQDKYDRLSGLMPYYRSHPEIRSVINEKSKVEWLKNLSSLYPFNSLLFNVFYNNTEQGKRKDKNIKGYSELEGTIADRDLKNVSPEKYEVDTVLVNYFKSFVTKCKEKNVKLFVVCSPYFMKLVTRDQSLDIAEKYLKSQNVSFLDYSVEGVFPQSPDYFKDLVHLNKEGSILFSKNLVSIIKQVK